ncbi:MAG: hypothetical protein ACLFVJ_03165 [Persicimonas sp.]
MIWVGAGASGCSDAYENSGPSDELIAGQLCVPSSEGCPSAATLRRASAIGANRLDFTLINEGGSAEIRVEAIEAADDRDEPADDADFGDGGSGDVGSGDVGPDAGGDSAGSVLVARTYSLAPGESISDRFMRTELFTRLSFGLRVYCDGCDARLEYALASEPLECRTDDDCSGGWLCSADDGRCIECRTNGDCADSQTCDLADGRCEPQRSSGCAHTDGSGSGAPMSLPPALLLVGLFSLALAGKRRRVWATAALALLASGVLDAPGARAAPPRAGINLGVGSRFLTGEMGEQSERGIGLSLSQELRGEYIGGRVELGANYFLTDQSAPPLSRELQLYTVGVGPQFYLPLGATKLVFGLDFRRVGLVSNSLVRITGPEVNHSGAGATVEARYRLAPFEVMVRGGFHSLFGLESSLISVDVAVGLATD